MTELAAATLDLLRDRFGHHAFRPAQAAAIARVLSSQSTLAVMPTGGGKSLTYQLPALLLAGTCVVISPLIALMHDQMRQARAHGLRAATLTSADDDRRTVEARLRGGGLDLLYVAPERASRDDFIALLAGVPLCLFAIDEAHCVSEWGHDFRPDYRALAPLLAAHPGIPLLALTATADAHTRADILDHFGIPDAGLVLCGCDRPNIVYAMEPRRQPVQRLTRLLREQPGSGIIYCRTRAETESLALTLARNGRDVLAYHAGMADDRRAAHQQRFFASPHTVMVATIAFGMGIDKPDVRFVAHLTPPTSIEAYYQETGRAGRDGAPALALMLWSKADVVRAAKRLAGVTPTLRAAETARQRAMAALIATRACRRAALLRYFGEAPPRTCGACDNCRRGRWRTAMAGVAGDVGRFLTHRLYTPGS